MKPLKAIIFDMDGVIYRGNSAVEGVPEAIDKLRKRGIASLFLTNNATRTRAQYAKRLASIGIAASENDIMTSSHGVASYILEKYGAGKSACIIGEGGMLKEAKKSGIEILALSSTSVPDFTIVSLDRSLTYEKAAAAHRFILQGSHFIAANSDPTLPLEHLSAPGSGSIVAMLEKSTGKKAEVVGKPNLFMLNELLREHKLAPKDAAFVGDRLEIDILMANKAGLYSILVLSGVANAADAKKTKGALKPKAILDSAAELPKFLGL
jgi:phosphoglycolate/pyridoxal phosphate phosphatase family enzyme